MLRIALTLALMSSSAMASVSCPATRNGHALASNDGAGLYVGNPASRMLLAPTRQARSMRDSNVWVLGQDGLTLVCQYEGSREALAATLPIGTRQCVQNLAANTMVCQ